MKWYHGIMPRLLKNKRKSLYLEDEAFCAKAMSSVRRRRNNGLLAERVVSLRIDRANARERERRSLSSGTAKLNEQENQERSSL